MSESSESVTISFIAFLLCPSAARRSFLRSVIAPAMASAMKFFTVVSVVRVGSGPEALDSSEKWGGEVRRSGLVAGVVSQCFSAGATSEPFSANVIFSGGEPMVSSAKVLETGLGLGELSDKSVICAN